jgi:hypothetical protein
LILLTAASIIIVIGCSKDSKNNNPLNPGSGDDNENENSGNQASVFINGDGFDLLQLYPTEGAAYYSPEENSTYSSIIAKTGTDTLLTLLATTDKEKGIFNWDNSEAISYLIVTRSDGYISYVSVNSGKTTITEYGDVNGYIKGTSLDQFIKVKQMIR